jgi:hypothetical protein
MKCSNGKYKYGEQGKCVFDTLAACNRAAAAIHIQDKVVELDDVEHKKYIADTVLDISRKMPF